MKIEYKNGASDTIVFAAVELREYLQRMLIELPGDDWIIHLNVSHDGDVSHNRDRSRCMDKDFINDGASGNVHDLEDQAADFESQDAFRVEVGTCGGSITGSNERSVLLGIYDYLQLLGCRFLMPKKDYEVVPHISRKQLTASYEKRASFLHRGVCIEGADSLENILDYVDWLPKAGFNSFFLQFKSPYAFLARWYGHEENPYAASEAYTAADAERDMAVIEREVKRRGLALHKAGHGWTGEVLGYHTVSWESEDQGGHELLRDRMALIDGQRQLFHGIPADTNLCYHNKDAAEAFVSLVADYAEKNPQTDYIHVWLADEYNNLCECEGCRASVLSDQYVELLNAIDERLAQKGINTRIVFLLYQELLWPPVESRIKNPDRFVLMFAPISRTFEQSYDLTGAELSKLPEFVRNHITLPTDLTENLAFLKGWQAVFEGDSFIYDYPLGRAHYGDFGYVHMAEVIHSDIQKLEQMGLHGYISCQELRAAFPNALPDYMMGHTLFSKEISKEEVVEEYFRACYGKDWEKVLAYLKGLSGFCSCDYVNGKGGRVNAAVTERMERVRELCLGCEGMIGAHRSAGGEWESIYWEILEYHRKYVILFAEALKQLSLGNKEQADCAWQKLRDEICIHEPEYQPFLDVYRILEVTKKYTGFCAGD